MAGGSAGARAYAAPRGFRRAVGTHAVLSGVLQGVLLAVIDIGLLMFFVAACAASGDVSDGAAFLIGGSIVGVTSAAVALWCCPTPLEEVSYFAPRECQILPLETIVAACPSSKINDVGERRDGPSHSSLWGAPVSEESARACPCGVLRKGGNHDSNYPHWRLAPESAARCAFISHWMGTSEGCPETTPTTSQRAVSTCDLIWGVFLPVFGRKRVVQRAMHVEPPTSWLSVCAGAIQDLLRHALEGVASERQDTPSNSRQISVLSTCSAIRLESHGSLPREIGHRSDLVGMDRMCLSKVVPRDASARIECPNVNTTRCRMCAPTFFLSRDGHCRGSCETCRSKCLSLQFCLGVLQRGPQPIRIMIKLQFVMKTIPSQNTRNNLPQVHDKPTVALTCSRYSFFWHWQRLLIKDAQTTCPQGCHMCTHVCGSSQDPLRRAWHWSDPVGIKNKPKNKVAIGPPTADAKSVIKRQADFVEQSEEY